MSAIGPGSQIEVAPPYVAPIPELLRGPASRIQVARTYPTLFRLTDEGWVPYERILL